jgi:hypothetical protein
LLLAFVSGCLPRYRRSCSELEADMSVSLDEYYSHCREQPADFDLPLYGLSLCVAASQLRLSLATFGPVEP